jgi:lauroyl/myristoyl acyltransferase
VRFLSLPLYPLFLAASFLTAFVPRRIGYAFAGLFSSIAYLLLPNRRRVMGANYAPVLGKAPDDPEIQRIGKLSFRNYGRYLYDFLRLPHVSIDEIDRMVTLHVADDFLGALQAGKGMIFVSAHFGNMDYTATALVKHYVRMTVVADMLQPKQLMDHLVEFRKKKGLTVVYNARAARSVIEALRRNEAVGFLIDVGCRRAGGIPVTFFGRQTMIPSGPALLALRTGAPIVVGYTVVEGDRIQGYSSPPIYAKPTGDKEADVLRCSQALAAHFEDFIRRYPEQWYIFRPMWSQEQSAGAAPATSGDGKQREQLSQSPGC